MKVLIVGGGIADLALALFLERDDVEVEIIDKAETWGRAGYGISLWTNGIRVLDALGLIERFFELGTPVRSGRCVMGRERS